MPSANAVVQRITLHLLVADKPSPAVQTDFIYEPSDPYALLVQFHTDTLVEWTFARELLHVGMTEATGMGDVRVAPAGPHTVKLELNSPSGTAVFEIPRSNLSSFLDRTFTAVPSTWESQFVDLDKELATLLGDC